MTGALSVAAVAVALRLSVSGAETPWAAELPCAQAGLARYEALAVAPLDLAGPGAFETIAAVLARAYAKTRRTPVRSRAGDPPLAAALRAAQCLLPGAGR